MAAVLPPEDALNSESIRASQEGNFCDPGVGQEVYQHFDHPEDLHPPPYFPLTHCPNCHFNLIQFLQSSHQSCMSQSEEQPQLPEQYGQTLGSSAQTPNYLLSSPERYPAQVGNQGSTDSPQVEQVHEYGDMDFQQPINIASLPSQSPIARQGLEYQDS